MGELKESDISDYLAAFSEYCGMISSHAKGLSAAIAQAGRRPTKRQLLLCTGLYQERPKRRALWRIAKANRLRCGARTRKGSPCKSLCVFGAGRCRVHGGLSTGAKTEEGRARIAEAQRRRWEAFRMMKATTAGESSL